MTTVTGSASNALLPFYTQYPDTSTSPGTSPGTNTAATSSGAPVDIVDIRSRLSGTFTAATGDVFSVSTLFTGAAASGGASIAGYRVALGDNTGQNGRLLLDGNDVTSQQSFTADEFSRLQYVAGAAGSSQSLTVVAQAGKTLSDGELFNEVDSPAVQITASVTGTRSINAVDALRTQATGSDADTVSIAQSAAIFTGYGAARPTLTTVGNLTAAANDVFSVSTLFTGAAASGGASIAGYRVALGDNTGQNGRLLLDGNDVTSQQSFTADEFSRLQYVAGAAGSSQSLTVVAQAGKTLSDGELFNEVDSPAVQITASVTGTRSINAVDALRTQATGSDADTVSIAQSAAIFTGYGAARPTLTTVGNLTAAASDVFSVSTLFTGTAASGGASIAGYRVALGDNTGQNGQLLLDGNDVTGQQSFTPDEFGRLQYVAGASGSSQSLTVVAQAGKTLSDGELFNEVDSPAVQITASVTGTRSINAVDALRTQATGSDADTVSIAQSAAIFTGYGAARPTLTTVGNLTAAANDVFSVSTLFTGAAASGGASIAGYRVALGDNTGQNGRLLLDGNDVTSQQSFTADEFGRLQYVAGAAGSNQSLTVVAQAGKTLSDGELFNEVDSPAVQITASVTGARSINAVDALRTQATGSDADTVSIAQSAAIFTGYGAARPTLTTVGNLTAAANDVFSVSTLFTGAAASAGASIAGYRVALGDNTGQNGQLLLDGNDVTGQQSFTPDEFSRLQYVAGAAGSSQSLTVVAQAGKTLSDGELFNEVDSPAVQITASVTGTRSINAVDALRTQATGSDADTVSIAQSAAIFTGYGAARPTLTTVGKLTYSDVDLAALRQLVGSLQSNQQITSGAINLLSGLSGEIGSSEISGSQPQQLADNTAEVTLIEELAATEIGGYQAAGYSSALHQQAISAYQVAAAT